MIITIPTKKVSESLNEAIQNNDSDCTIHVDEYEIVPEISTNILIGEIKSRKKIKALLDKASYEDLKEEMKFRNEFHFDDEFIFVDSLEKYPIRETLIQVLNLSQSPSLEDILQAVKENYYK